MVHDFKRYFQNVTKRIDRVITLLERIEQKLQEIDDDL